MPKWIHDRAEHILAKNPSMSKSQAFAIATQQAHALGKSPKGYGTAQGRRVAKAKYSTPKDDKKVANPGHLSRDKLAAMSAAPTDILNGPARKPLIGAGIGTVIGGAAGAAKHALEDAPPEGTEPSAAGWRGYVAPVAIGAGAGLAVGTGAGLLANRLKPSKVKTPAGRPGEVMLDPQAAPKPSPGLGGPPPDVEVPQLEDPRRALPHVVGPGESIPDITAGDVNLDDLRQRFWELSRRVGNLTPAERAEWDALLKKPGVVEF